MLARWALSSREAWRVRSVDPFFPRDPGRFRPFLTDRVDLSREARYVGRPGPLPNAWPDLCWEG